jgi:hypothetical protein
MGVSSRLSKEKQGASAVKKAESKTIFIACAALGREVKNIIKKHSWNADFQAIDARLHLYPRKIGLAVEERLENLDEKYQRKIVVYGHCGAMDLDSILEKYGALRPLGPHCYEMYGAEAFAEAVREEPGTFILTDYLIHAWDTFVVRGLKIDKHPQLKDLMFEHYKRIIYFSQEEDQKMVAKAQDIADWLGLILEVQHVEYGDLERRLVAIMEDRDQPTAGMTLDGYSAGSYPVAG